MLACLSRPRALLCFYLYLNIVVAGVVQPLRRQDEERSTTPPLSVSSTAGNDDIVSTASVSASAESTIASVTASPSATSISRSSTAASVSATATVTSTSGDLNSTLFNVTIAAGELPLTPEVTPGWGVAGVILMLSGAVYALIGIKKQWLHTFFSTAFLGGLGVAVLILYVMTPPISDAVQGGYVVAAVGTGCILGGGAVVFKEITECIACAIGGFCLSMWLLSLREGGLLGAFNDAGVAAFISVFSVVAFLFYFSRWTRHYAMIVCISFSGATATVIGIDCFSRAGLKEFWAYIWDINDNLFPLGASTYPLTRGIRVEQAVTVIITIVGIVAQLRLWRVIQERRQRKDAQRLEDEQTYQAEEEVVGRDVERANARERRAWEAVYGDGTANTSTTVTAVDGDAGDGVTSPRSVHYSEDSGVGDLESEKQRRRHSHGTTTATRRSTGGDEENIEMAELPIQEEEGDSASAEAEPPKPKIAAEMVMEKDEQKGTVTVRVAVDDLDDGALVGEANAASLVENEKGRTAGADDEARLFVAQPSADDARSSVHSTSPAPAPAPAPSVVPLPFKVPTVETQEPDKDDGDRSSVATFADEDDDRQETRSARSSLVKRLSVSSADLFRKISQRSLAAKHKDGAAPPEEGESREDLVSPVSATFDDRGSIAATVDLSSDDDMNASVGTGVPFSKDIKAELGGQESTSRQEAKSSQADASGPKAAEKPDEATGEKDKKSVMEGDSEPKPGKSVVSEVEPGPVSLTKDRLPKAMSKIALSYRTNEWAKHLSNAEIPEPDRLELEEMDEPQQPELEPVQEEAAAPVKVDELQQTADKANVPLAMPRSASVMSRPESHHSPANLAVPRSQSSLSNRTPPHSPTYLSASGSPNQGHLQPPRRSKEQRRTSGRIPEAINEDGDGKSTASSAGRQQEEEGGHSGATSPRSSINPYESSPASTAAVSRPPVPGVVSYSSPQTLIGKRDMLLRAKSQVLRPESRQLTPVTSAAASDAGSVYNHSGTAPLQYATVAGVGPGSGRDSAALAQNAGLDVDDVPLSQRKQIMRQNSMMSVASQRSSFNANVNASTGTVGNTGPVKFNSHQPQRTSTVPPAAVREAQLASFRQSVQADLRTSTMPAASHNANYQLNGATGFGVSGPANGPLINAVNNGGSLYGLSPANSSGSLGVGGAGYGNLSSSSLREAEVQRDMDMRRSVMLSQKQAEARRGEAERWERERGNRMVEERMRAGDMLEAHREAMRRMQRAASAADRRS